MAQFPVPPGFEETVGKRRRRRRRRRVAIGAVVAVLLGVVGVTGFQLLRDSLDAAPTAARGQPSVTPGAGTTCEEPATDLAVLSTPDTAPLLTTLAADFTENGSAADGHCVRVAVNALESGDAVRALTAEWADWDETNGPRPDVWTPSSSTWVALLAARLEQAGRDPLVDASATAADGTVHLATSPTVLAMPRPMARALGWPEETIDWTTLRTLALAPDGWGEADHRDWGRFRLALPDPRTSGSGLNAVTALYEEAADGERLTTDALGTSTADETVGAVQQAAVEDRTDTDLLAEWAKADARDEALTFLSALFTDEAGVAAYNRASPSVPLVAVYPGGAALLDDHPYVVLDADRASPEKEAAASAFADYLTGPEARSAFRAAHFRDPDGTLADPSGDAAALGLDPQQPATVLDPVAPALVEVMFTRWRISRTPSTILTVLDVSESMRSRIEGSSQTKLDAAKDAAITSLNLYSDRDEVGLWSFSSNHASGRDYTALVPVGPMTADVDGVPRREAIKEAVDGLTARGRTALYATLSAALTSAQARVQADRTTMIILTTDGQNDDDGDVSLNELLAQIRATPAGRQVRIVTIAYGPDADQRTLARIAEASGGATFVAPRPEDLPRVAAEAFRRMSAEAAAQDTP